MSEAPLIHRVALVVLAFVIGCGASKPRPAFAPSTSRPTIQTHPRDGMKELECKPDIDPSRDPAIRKTACEAGDLHACHLLLGSDHPTEALTEIATRTLESACTGNGVALAHSPCACALYGSALTFDPRHRFDERALTLLSQACSDGALPACDELALVGDLCSQRGEDRPLCEKLRLAGLAHAPPPEPPPPIVDAQLPEYLHDCFVVVRDLGADKCEVARDSGEGICEIDPSACPKVAPGAPLCATRRLGAVYCFAPDRILLRAPREAAWKQQRAHWRVARGDATFIGPELSVRLDGRDVLIDGRYRLVRADESTRASATKFMTFGIEICIHAKTCIDAIERVVRIEPIDAPVTEFPSDAAACAKAEAEARRLFTGTLPNACR